MDGNRFSSGLCPHKCIVGGDDRSMSIAAASIIAKVYRDEWMIDLHEEYPHYSWNTNVGYPTAQHYEGLKNTVLPSGTGRVLTSAPRRCSMWISLSVNTELTFVKVEVQTDAQHNSIGDERRSPITDEG
ncbi:MAG: hypothetical protein U5J63_12065 [Fodinibius sp.]|nr:hypothetical protein [Fodinibius sp.]